MINNINSMYAYVILFDALGLVNIRYWAQTVASVDIDKGINILLQPAAAFQPIPLFAVTWKWTLVGQSDEIY